MPATKPLRPTKKRPERSNPELVSSAPNGLDSIDRQIISHLQRDGRRAYGAIASEVGLSEAGVRRRVQRLKDSGVMQIVAITDPLQLGYGREALIGIRVHGDVRLVADKIASIDEANYVVMTAGSFDIIAEVIAVDDDALVHLLNDSIRSIPGVTEVETFLYLKLFKADIRMGDQVTLNTISDGIEFADEKHASHNYSERARRHLWLQMSRMGAYDDLNEVPIMVRGEGTRVYDANGTEYFDGLSGLFTNMLGHGRADIAAAAAEQMTTMAFFPLWTYAHPKAIELAEKIASLAPGDLNRVFFTSGGAEANESAWKLARQYHKMRGDTDRYKVISRDVAYHGTTLGALTITSLEGYRQPFEPLVPGAVKVPAVNFYRAEQYGDDFEAFGLWQAHQIEEAILREGPETVAAVFLEPVQNAGGCFTPPPNYWQSVREICDRYGVILVSDDVICAFGRLGTWFGGQKFDYVPDIITCAKGITAGYAPLGAMIVSDRLAEPFQHGDASFVHGFTWSGHPVSCAVALKSIEILEKEQVLENVLANQDYFRDSLLNLRDIPIVGDVRGTGYFWGVELVKNQMTKETWAGEDAERLLRGYVSPEMFRRGLICRSDDRGDPVVQLAPPLISTRADIDFMVGTMREVFTGAVKFI